MAPAAASTLSRYFAKSGHSPEDFDGIYTGDLGYEGSSLLCELLVAEGLDLRDRHDDCGMMIYSKEKQDMHSGGSGCGCSAVILASHLVPRIKRGDLRRILFIGTGAMMSPASLQQGEAIPAVAHLLCICNEKYCF